MRHLLTIIGVVIVAVTVFMKVDWRAIRTPKGDVLDMAICADTMATIQQAPDHPSHDRPLNVRKSDEECGLDYDDDLCSDTVMGFKGHAFCSRGDVSIRRGWYLDSDFVGDDYMMRYDSVGPSSLGLDLITRNIIVDLADPDATKKIKTFMGPVGGFKRFKRTYEACLDSVVDVEYGVRKFMGEVTYIVDYLDRRDMNADKISRFLCHLSHGSENGKAHVSTLSAFYAGYNPNKAYRPVYKGKPEDLSSLSDFVADKTFENWIRCGSLGIGSNVSSLEIRAHVLTPKFVTFSKYEYEREGIGHGMYTETFHTLDLTTGKELSNDDIFRAGALDKVKQRLFEVMANDAHYLEWRDVSNPSEIEAQIEIWREPLDLLEGTGWEESGTDVAFQLPDAALTDKGVVFSFQPYEIECWAAGAFHFVVPYEKIRSLLTPHVKRLVAKVH